MENETCPYYDLKKTILLDLSQNVHKYVRKEYGTENANLASRIIYNVSSINKDLYKELDKQRNDPITARTIITNFSAIPRTIITNISPSNIYLMRRYLKTPGAKKCFELSEQLYLPDLTTDKIMQLFHKGALLDYTGQHSHQSVLNHWIYPYNNNAIVKKLLELGASPNTAHKHKKPPLELAIELRKRETFEIIFNYNPIKTQAVWNAALQAHHQRNNHIDLMISNSTYNELNDGLIACTTTYHNYTEIMQEFIDKGADPNIALSPSINEISLIDINDTNSVSIKKFNLLCDQKAFDKKAIIQLQQIIDFFVSCKNKLENNQPVIEIK